ncbi:questin oxidase family protein [Streptomyces bambusae]|uniref:questin oxidase family protein n=1 Tax=Streptomyces bambusae TaxID=1550616 RepID=UPI001D000FC6|nr:questin oxidase family protein [Streptomyces bambusae]MCB5170190.1 questin oxidase family protein [Streptomyces bambusae]
MPGLTYGDAVTEALDRLRGTGFEHGPQFVNHAPMAAEALAHMGYADEVPGWVDHILRAHSYHDVPETRWTIDPADRSDWQSALGDFSRVADWTALFVRELDEGPWTDVLARWWPRLLPGMSGVLTHGVIRTAHAVRAVAREGGDDALRRGELAQGLAYWAARYSGPGPDGSDRTPADTAGAVVLPEPAERTAADLDALVAEYAGIYATTAQRHPIPLIHAITGPAAVRLVVPHLPPAQRRPSYEAARETSRKMLRWFQAGPRTGPAPALPEAPDVGRLFAEAVEIGDEHAIKLAEVAVRHEALAPDPRHAAAAHVANQGLRRFYTP